MFSDSRRCTVRRYGGMLGLVFASVEFYWAVRFTTVGEVEVEANSVGSLLIVAIFLLAIGLPLVAGCAVSLLHYS